MSKVHYDDTRLIQPSKDIWVERISEKEWHECKYCYKEVPTFLLKETVHQLGRTGVLRCCWECGAGLDRLDNDE
jgi:hypothetical protein